MKVEYIDGMTSKDYIQHIISERGQWNIPKEDYWEGHHIIPRCLGGTGCAKNKHENIVRLYADEHFIIHKLLALENPNNRSLVFAYSAMAFPKSPKYKNNRHTVTPEEYEEARLLLSKLLGSNKNPWLKNGEPWNKGLTKETDKRIAEYSKKVSNTKKGKKLGPNSDNVKKKKSAAQKKRYLEHPEQFISHTKGKVCITNGDDNFYINKEDSIPDGFHYGMTCTKERDLSWRKSEEGRKQISLQTSGEKNGMYGKGYKLAGGKNGKAIYIYTFNNVDYDCRDALMVVLKQIYPTISESTIKKIQDGNYTKTITNRYPDLVKNLSWRLKEKYANKIN